MPHVVAGDHGMLYLYMNSVNAEVSHKAKSYLNQSAALTQRRFKLKVRSVTVKYKPLTFSTSNEFQIFLSFGSVLPGDVFQ